MGLESDPYRGFARRYGRFYSGFGMHEPTHEALFRTLFERHGVRRVLDCACGVGQDLHLFHKLGCEAYGVDLSEAMLDEARRNLTSVGLDAPLIRADFRELPFLDDTRFDAVTCLSTSLPHLLEEGEIVRALRGMRGALRDGGILVLTQGMCDRQLREQQRFIPVIQTHDLSRLYVIDYGSETLTIHVLDVIHTEAEQDFHVHDFTYRILLRDDYARLLDAAGYSAWQFYDSHDLRPYDQQESQRLIVVAER